MTSGWLSILLSGVFGLSRAGYVNLFVLIVSIFLQAVVEPRGILHKEQGIAFNGIL